MTSIREAIKRFLEPKELLPVGIYHYQSPPDVEEPYRIHLRVEKNGRGILILNASTVLHLNQTATEYAYHLVNQTPDEEVVEQIHNRYRVNKLDIQNDYNEFKDKIDTLIEMPDLDPEIYIGLDRTSPYPEDISAPYRLDCAITYKLPEGVDPEYAPTKRVDRELTTDEWISTIEKLWRAGIPHLIFTGGEPTMREDLPQLLEYAENQGQVTGLNTDGIKLLDADYFEKLLLTGLDHITLVMDPNNKVIWETIKKIIAADIYLIAHLTVTLNNVVDAPEIIKRLRDQGLKNISLSTSDPALFSTLNELRDQSAELGLSLVWDLPVPYSAFNPVALELREDTPSQADNKSWLYIEPDGDVLPTQGVDIKLGNIITDSWENIWSTSNRITAGSGKIAEDQ